MAALVGGCRTFVFGLHRSQELGISENSQTIESSFLFLFWLCFLTDLIFHLLFAQGSGTAKQTLSLGSTTPMKKWTHLNLFCPLLLVLGQGCWTLNRRWRPLSTSNPIAQAPLSKRNHRNHVFGIHSLPRDIVSYCGPQFAAKFWAEFCRLLDTSVRFSPPDQRPDGVPEPAA